MSITFTAYTDKPLTARLHRAPRIRMYGLAGAGVGGGGSDGASGGLCELQRAHHVTLQGARHVSSTARLHRAARVRLSDQPALFVLHRAAQLVLSGAAPIPTATVFSLSAPGHQVGMQAVVTRNLTMQLHHQPRLLLADASARMLLRRPHRVYLYDGTPTMNRTALLLQQPVLVASAVPGITLALADTFSADGQPDADLIHALLDLFSAGDSYSHAAEVLQALADGASLADVAGMIIAAGLLDNFVASAVLDGTAQITVMLSDSLLASDTSTPLSVILAAISDSFYAALTIATGEDAWTAWVMTTQSRAMRRYTNWPFNSYAMLGGQLIGAGKDGIYRIGGSSDAGAAIAWAIRTGKLNFGNLQMKSVPLAYIGATSTGEILLKVRATTTRGDEVEQTYRMSPSTSADPRQRRGKIGRGFRSVYWTFEITNDADGGAAEITDWHALPVNHTGKLI